MNEAKFTKGPWERLSVPGMDTESNGIRVFAPTGMVALAMSPRYGADEAQPNANLIAVAPEMYEALEKLEAIFSLVATKAGGGPIEEILIHYVKPALAKARGE